jgi:hypothetical protein
MDVSSIYNLRTRRTIVTKSPLNIVSIYSAVAICGPEHCIIFHNLTENNSRHYMWIPCILVCFSWRCVRWTVTTTFLLLHSVHKINSDLHIQRQSCRSALILNRCTFNFHIPLFFTATSLRILMLRSLLGLLLSFGGSRYLNNEGLRNLYL